MRPATPPLLSVPALLWLLLFGAVLSWSATNPHDRLTWWLEVFPALGALLLLAVTRRYFRLTPLCYGLILAHCMILMVGGHYTYARVPLFDLIADWFGWTRNNFDKLAHFVQGFVPAIIARELLLRKRVVNGGGWRALFVVCFCLALSAFYEMIEWWVAVFSGTAAEAFLGTQGYVWDTQSDMFMALVGAIAAILLLSGVHDRQLRRLKNGA